MPVGVDTGFFYLVRDGHPEALRILREEAVITSAIVVYELQRHILKGAFVDGIMERSVEVISLNAGMAKKAARIAHTFGIPTLDSLILGSLVEAGCKKIYSADPHFKEFKEKNIKVIQLKKSDS
ncbi:MAG: PIN domain-containing protein [Nitrospiraceae bacterium]|nr:PIN domain-containing protein [Nitrospiraceae bacterium]